MSAAIQSDWRSTARTEFPQAEKIIGDGPYLLVPCVAGGLVRLFRSKAEAHAKRDLKCCPLCCGGHRGIVLKPPAPAPRAPLYSMADRFPDRD